MLNQHPLTVDRVRAYIRQLEAREPELTRQLLAASQAPLPEGLDPAGAALYEAVGGSESGLAAAADMAYETIVLRSGRPVLAIRRDAAEITVVEPEAEVLRQRLLAARPFLAQAIPAVGRIEVVNGERDWEGTGWLVADGVLVTNRHVAQNFGMRDNARFVFRPGVDPNRPRSARVDFLEEIGNPDARELIIEEILHIEPPRGPDVAFLRLAAFDRATAAPIALATMAAATATPVAVIGYPARDGRILDAELMDRIYGNVYNKKRLAPGLITGGEDGLVVHDCTTLGGNSGSVVLDLLTGQAVGLHFSGRYLQANYAVAAKVVARLLRERPWQGGTRPPERPQPPAAGDAAGTGGTAGGASDTVATAAVAVSVGDGRVTMTVPLEISVRLAPGGGTAQTPAITVAAPATPATPAPAGGVGAAVAAVADRLAGRDEVVTVAAGYRFRDGWITGDAAVVVRVRGDRPLDAAGLGLPATVAGFPLEVRTADPAVLLRLETGMTEEAAHRYVANYRPRPEPQFALDAVEERMRLTVHVSPEAGWRQLSGFLAGVDAELVVGMYDFTAPHIVDAVSQAIGPAGRQMTLVLQHNASIGDGTKANDLPDETVVANLEALAGDRFQSAWAPVTGPARLFDSAYHIKVAVRDGASVWLSSGNWQSSNQPNVADPLAGAPDPALLATYNREWHVIVENRRLAQVFRAHLRQDFADAEALPEAPDTALLPDLLVPAAYLVAGDEERPRETRFFPPLVVDRVVRVQPLLTPDNYAERVLDFIAGAETALLIQNQTIRPAAGDNDPRFEEILAAVRAKQQAGLDVRLIFRRIGDVRDTLERLQRFGFDMTRVRLQTNCHTKGIIVDARAVLLGSHNWTNAGTLFNRDASLIIDDAEIARYCRELFEFDWARIARVRVPEDAALGARPFIAAGREAPTPPGLARVSWAEWVGA